MNSTKFLCLSALLFVFLVINLESTESALVRDRRDTYGCPLDSQCKKTCIDNGFADGKCEGLTHLTCHCIG